MVSHPKIAINDNYDSLFSESNELAPFKNLFNEWYARDTSKKIRAVFKAKAERGERLSTQIPYGYRRDPNSGKECHLLINEETAPVVKMIFSMCAEGIGPSNISKALEERKILKPTMYRFMREGKYGTHTDTENPYKWNERTIADILDKEIYLGHTINCRTRIASFKDKRTIKVPKEEQLRFENTHEPIIDQETWDIVRKVREGRIRKTRMGEINKYSGLISAEEEQSSVKATVSSAETITSTSVKKNVRRTQSERLCSTKLCLKKSTRRSTTRGTTQRSLPITSVKRLPHSTEKS